MLCPIFFSIFFYIKIGLKTALKILNPSGAKYCFFTNYLLPYLYWFKIFSVFISVSRFWTYFDVKKDREKKSPEHKHLVFR